MPDETLLVHTPDVVQRLSLPADRWVEVLGTHAGGVTSASSRRPGPAA